MGSDFLQNHFVVDIFLIFGFLVHLSCIIWHGPGFCATCRVPWGTKVLDVIHIIGVEYSNSQIRKDSGIILLVLTYHSQCLGVPAARF